MAADLTVDDLIVAADCLEHLGLPACEKLRQIVNVDTGETVDFCGDSVASYLAHPMERPDDWDEKQARKRNAEIYGRMSGI